MELFQHEMYITSVEETTRFWSIVAQRYADEPVILMYELYNEPAVSGDDFGEMSWEEWKKINEEIIQLIREIHPGSVIGVAGFNWAYDLTPVREKPIDAPAIVYISHPYPEKREAPWEEKWETDWEYTPTRQGVFFKKVMSRE